MSEQELLKQVRGMSRARRKRLVNQIAAMDVPAKKKKEPPKAVKWPNVLEQALKITGGRIIPNMVLLEREESRT